MTKPIKTAIKPEIDRRGRKKSRPVSLSELELDNARANEMREEWLAEREMKLKARDG